MPMFLSLAILSKVAKIHSTGGTVFVKLATFSISGPGSPVSSPTFIAAVVSVRDSCTTVVAVVDGIGECGNLGGQIFVVV